MSEPVDVSDDASLALLRALIEAWGDVAESVSVPILDDGPARGLGTWIHATHAVDTARSVVLLYENEMRIQAVPLLRLVLECAVTAVWLATEENSAEAAFAEAKRQHVLLMRALDEMANDSPDPELAELLAEADAAASNEGRRFEARCKKLDNGEWLYTSYRILSQLSHAGSGLYPAYLHQVEFDPEYGHGYAIVDPQTHVTLGVTLYTGVLFLHMAMAAWVSLEPDGARADALREFEVTHNRRSPFPSGV